MIRNALMAQLAGHPIALDPAADINALFSAAADRIAEIEGRGRQWQVRALCEDLRASGGPPPVFVFTSSIGVYGVPLPRLGFF